MKCLEINIIFAPNKKITHEKNYPTFHNCRHYFRLCRTATSAATQLPAIANQLPTLINQQNLNIAGGLKEALEQRDK